MYRERMLKWIEELADPSTRGTALRELSVHRESFPDLAPMLWQDMSKLMFVLQEISSIHHTIHLGLLPPDKVQRVCHALILLHCLAAHPETRTAFLAANLPLLLYPFLYIQHSTSQLECLRYRSLAVIETLVLSKEQQVIKFLLSTKFVPVCLRIMVSKEEPCKKYATFILEQILLDDIGVSYNCQTYERFGLIAVHLRELVSSLSKKPSVKILKCVITCYSRLADNPRFRRMLRRYLPYTLRDGTFAAYLQLDASAKHCLTMLLKKLFEPQTPYTSDAYALD
uniref:CCR4-NOT transcription complex subunit 9 n=1 Tax=Anopheles maculatus TaxID=74869 RepID=A0A182SJ78_9DIPT